MKGFCMRQSPSENEENFGGFTSKSVDKPNDNVMERERPGEWGRRRVIKSVHGCETVDTVGSSTGDRGRLERGDHTALGEGYSKEKPVRAQREVERAKEPLPRSAEPGYLVTRIVAMDADDGENARLSYSIQRGNENGMFRMDWRTGELRTARRVSAKRDPHQLYDLLIEVRDHGQPPLSSSASVLVMLVDSVAEGRGGGDRGGATKAKDGTLDLTLILIIALGSVSFIFLLVMIVLAVRCQKDKKLNIYTCLASDCCLGCSSCCSRQSRARKKKLSKSDIMLVQSAVNVSGAGTAQVPVEESGSFGSHHQNQNYCYQVCLTPESAKTDLMFLKPCSPSRSTDTDHNPCGAIVTGYTDQQPDIISNGSILSNETKHQRAELSYLVDRPRRVNSSAFQEADLVSSKDSGHGDSEQGDSDHDATNRGHSSGTHLSLYNRAPLSYECLFYVFIQRQAFFGAGPLWMEPVIMSGQPQQGPSTCQMELACHFHCHSSADLFSNCTEECKALGHSDRCWMPSFVPSDGRQGPDYRSNLHVPGMDSVPDTEVQAWAWGRVRGGVQRGRREGGMIARAQ
eukprot:superscaffoldBa00002385_g14083